MDTGAFWDVLSGEDAESSRGIGVDSDFEEVRFEPVWYGLADFSRKRVQSLLVRAIAAREGTLAMLIDPNSGSY